jgi:hypothetical protein
LRWVAWKAATRAALGTAERWKAGRSCWASGRLMVEPARVDSMRCAAAGVEKAGLARLGRMIEAIAQSGWAEHAGRGVETLDAAVGIPRSVVDNASGLRC